MKTDSLSAGYFKYLREELLRKWISLNYGDNSITASKLKKIIKKGLVDFPESKIKIIESFLDMKEVDDYFILNRCKCIENFCKNKTSKLSDHTLSFIVNFFDIEIKSIEEFKQKKPQQHAINSLQIFQDKRHNQLVDKLFHCLANENPDNLSDVIKELLLEATILLGLPFIKESILLNKNNKNAIHKIYRLLYDADECISLRAKFALSLLDQNSNSRSEPEKKLKQVDY